MKEVNFIEDKRYQELLNLLQEELPLVPQPFQELGKKVGLTEEEILNFLKILRERGVLRHLGASPDSHRLGHFTCLLACSLPEGRLHIAEEIAELPEVTHAYLRDHKLNFWFTLVLPRKEDLEPYIKALEERFSVKIYAFPAKRKFKVRAVFKL